MKEQRLFYTSPAVDWSEALPVGNGRLGAMIYGSVPEAKFQLNEESIWSGKHLDRINPEAKTHLEEVRTLLREGKYEDAENLAMQSMAGIPASMRAYQTAGELRIQIHEGKNITEYERSLDLEKAVAETCYVADGVHFYRSCFASAPDQCLVIRIWNEERIPFDLTCTLHRGHDAERVTAPTARMIMLHGNEDCGGIPFAVALAAAADGGEIRTLGETLLVSHVKEAVFTLSIDTAWRDPKNYQEKALRTAQTAVQKTYQMLLDAHLMDYLPLYRGLELDMGEEHTGFSLNEKTDQADSTGKNPTDIRLAALKNGQEDSELLLLLFQYGRYLLVSSSRPGSIPANLQGIWNQDFMPKWDSKYTININLQMNYWAADAENLPSCTEPFFDLLERVRESGENTAWQMYGCRGSVAHHNTDIFADTAPQDHWRPGTIWVMGEAWLATHVYEHYLYTRNKEFLRKHFAVLEDCVLFFEDFLVEDENGSLVVTPSCSPENSYVEDGKKASFCESCAMDVELLTELFTDYLDACRILDLPDREQEKVRQMLAKQPLLVIGKNGELLEWRKEVEETEPGHRHLSHLYGVYPGHMINANKTPALFHAAEVSLDRRLDAGGGSTGWSRAWAACLLADFGRGEDAYGSLQNLAAHYLQPNLLDLCPANDRDWFQIDGNFGLCAAVMEMLVQCRENKMILLPAIPRQFETGTVRGIHTRLGASVDMMWKRGRVTHCRITPKETMDVVLIANNEDRPLHLDSGKTIEISFSNIKL